MRRLLAYSGITTKIRAMQSHFITQEEYKAIASLGSVPEVVGYLKGHPAYAEYFKDLDQTSIHRGELEHLLKHTVFYDFSKIYRFSNLEQRRFMELYFLRYEITILKSCLRSVFDKRDIDLDLSYFQDFFVKHASIDVTKVTAGSTIADFVSNLKGTIYFPCFSKLEHLSSPTLFDYEMALDLFYFTYFWKMSHKLYSKSQLDVLRETTGHKIDMLNIQWIYRSKKYYKLSPADIYALIIPIRYHLKKNELSSMVESSSISELAAIVRQTYYGRVFEEADVTTLEKMYRYVLNKIYTETARKYPYSIACINTYLYNKEYEISKLTSALEGIRYALPAENILKIIS